MTNERKASDILFSLESDMKQLIALYRSQDLVLKVLANKLNTTLDVMNGLQLAVESLYSSAGDGADVPKAHQEYTDTQAIKTSNEFKLTVEDEPKGFRRTSRPETYNVVAPTAKILQNNSVPTISAAQPTQKLSQDVQFADFNPDSEPQPIGPQIKQAMESYENKIPVQQRIVDKNGKAIFLANIEIFNSKSGVSEFKGRTNGVGKWQAALIPGNYKVKIKKQESVSKEKIDLTQDISIDGLSTTQELPILVCK